MNALSFDCLLHSFWRWTCACSMHLRNMTTKKMC
ncbi:Tfp pilus assembly protein [Vibrio cholerae]|nr:Tfp pilus assembly protein [Vibrio cholerae]